jgi:ribosome-associated translation inhibitor RaiA
MKIMMKYTNLPVDAQSRLFLERKLAEALRILGSTHPEPIELRVELERTSKRHAEHPDDERGIRRYRAEATMIVPGTMLRAEASDANLARAIVEMKHRLTRQIGDWRSRCEDASRGAAEQDPRSPRAAGEHLS